MDKNLSDEYKEPLNEWDDDYEDDDEDDDYDYDYDYEDTVFKSKVKDYVRERSAKYVGRNITWYGTKGESAIVPMDSIVGLDGNIYNPDKIDYLINKIENMHENIELTTGYCSPYLVSYGYIKEILVDRANSDDYYEDEDTNDNYTLGDDELDEYIVDIETVVDLYGNEYEIQEIFKHYHTLVGSGEKSLSDLKKGLLIAIRENMEKDEDERFNKEDIMNAYRAFKNMEMRLKKAIEDEDGDINRMMYQMRDGHHRWQTAKALGETEILCDVDKNKIRQYGEYLNII